MAPTKSVAAEHRNADRFLNTQVHDALDVIPARVILRVARKHALFLGDHVVENRAADF